MNLKKLTNLISSIFSLSLTVLLLGTVVYGWYINNQTVNATGITASSKNSDIWDVRLSRYVANEESTNITYNPLSPVTTDNIQSYDSIAQYDKIVYVITYKTTLSQITLEMENTNENRNEEITSDVGNSSIGYNYLSNVAIFNLLSGEYNSLSKTTDEYQFSYCTEIAKEKITIATVESSEFDDYFEGTIFLLFDYNSDNINALFTANLGTSCEKVYFREDIRFYLQ